MVDATSATILGTPSEQCLERRGKFADRREHGDFPTASAQKLRLPGSGILTASHHHSLAGEAPEYRKLGKRLDPKGRLGPALDIGVFQFKHANLH